MTATSRTINDGWTFTQIGGGDVVKKDEWINVKDFPTTVHVELLKEKRIPDPVSGPLISTLPSFARILGLGSQNKFERF